MRQKRVSIEWLRMRHSVLPSDLGYDAHILACIKSLTIVDPVSGCWLWQGSLTTSGYGAVGYRGAKNVAHRLMWTLTHGSIPAGKDICHTCDVRRCCNPDHLWLGDRRSNTHDMWAKGRAWQQRTHCKRGHAFAEHGYFMKARDGSGKQWRHCRECDRIHHSKPTYIEWRREYQRRRKAAQRAARVSQEQA